MTIFISDCHLGNRHCDAQKLYSFLVNYGAGHDTIICVGDIIDDHQMQNCPMVHWYALNQILSFKKIVLTPGNHDSIFRKFFGVYFDGRVIITDQYSYLANNGKSYLVVHGDKQDDWIKYTHFVSSSWFARISRKFFTNFHSKYLKDFTKDHLIDLTKEIGYQGVICGHTHRPEITVENGIEYINCGDWTDNFCGVVEKDGKFKLVFM